MPNHMIAIGATLVAGISTGLGALPIYFKKEFSKSALDMGMGFSAGVMLVASFISLILPGIEEARKIFTGSLSILIVLAGIFVGYLSIIYIHNRLPHEHLIKEKDVVIKKRLTRVSLIILAIALHNLPEGLAVGVGFGADHLATGLAIALAISIQNLPEGLVVAFGLLSAGASKHKAFLMALLSGLVEPMAAVLGFAATRLAAFALPVSLGFAGGAMLFVICQEMFPELFRNGHEKNATLGVILGISVMLLIDFYLG